VNPGKTEDAITITQIAPTLAAFLKIYSPLGAMAKPIITLVK
jgi:hypothetical protein